MSYLVLIETSGNQAYIFSTNKLRECIGASELTFRSGTQWVLEAVESVGGPKGLWQENATPMTIRQNILKESLNDDISIITAISGKAILKVDTKEKAQAIIQNVTQRALEDAPGLDISGVIVPLKDFTFDQAIQDAHQRMDQHKNVKPSTAERFLNYPITASCHHAPLPASGVIKIKQGNNTDSFMPLSESSIKKREHEELWQQRVDRILQSSHQAYASNKDIPLPPVETKIDVLETHIESSSWIAVVHADGNGLGQIFTRFREYASEMDEEAYTQAFRSFSQSLDSITEKAFYEACNKLHRHRNNEKKLPIVPLLLGGDDLTLIMDGELALPFTQHFLEAFEQAFELDLPEVQLAANFAERAFGVKRLGICAGVAIVKPHFPFHDAHRLAEDLIKNAKSVKHNVQKQNQDNIVSVPCSALDFHILYDSVFTDLNSIRARLTYSLQEQTYQLFSGPYVVTPLKDLESLLQSNLQSPPSDEKDTTLPIKSLRWANDHHLSHLMARTEALQATHSEESDADAKQKLPNGIMHRLRDSLFYGAAHSDARLREAIALCKLKDIQPLLEKTENASAENHHTLFRQVPVSETTWHLQTRFMDALLSAPFWPKTSTRQNHSEEPTQ